MAVSNDRIQAILDEMESYESPYTGEEIDNAVRVANTLLPWIDRNLAVPHTVYVGDTTRKVLTTLDKDMWLKSVILVCKSAFSASVTNIRYQVGSNTDGVFFTIPGEFMIDTGAVLQYDINKLITAGTELVLISTGTTAYGEILVKLEMA